ncbi:YheC/YheD family protein [Paenibacillus hamazuiensis]|uniref:YheC/YheD family protein n=1 Tax=Paenibacillus hamazuiensis TaxID=2936508 RepID=UPI00200F4C1C|nr:YheC/YheD family protein [Paenibacillus hamazuiensis]
MRHVANKWTKFEILLRHDGASKHVPAMRVYSSESLKAMLQQFSFVVAKPFIGTGGHLVVKIERAQGGYFLHYYGSKKRYGTFEGLVAALNRIRKGRQYMVQQGIHLTRIGGRPVDYRVKMVKTGRSWAIRAVVGRLARPGLFVTNICRGGTLMRGRDALRRTFPASLVRSKIATMVGVARTCTFLLESHFPGIGALGYDFGVDRQGRVWILEVNTNPH